MDHHHGSGSLSADKAERLFSADEVVAFQKDDIKTTRIVVLFLTIIFILGLFLYLGVLYFVFKYPQHT